VNLKGLLDLNKESDVDNLVCIVVALASLIIMQVGHFTYPITSMVICMVMFFSTGVFTLEKIKGGFHV
jgi:hypothetical protein